MPFEAPKPQEIPILKQEPDDYEVHPRNFMRTIGANIARFRSTLPKEYRSQEGFAKMLVPFCGKPVNKNLIARMEQGDESISIGMYAACFDIMKVSRRITDQFTTESSLGDEGDNLLLENIRSSGLAKAIASAKNKVATK